MPTNNIFNEIKTTMYGTPTDAKSSYEYYAKNLKAKIDSTYKFAPDTNTIGEELIRGTQIYSDVECRIVSAINPKTGNNIGDDFKDLKFFDLEKNRSTGDRFFFSNSVWIATNSDNYKYMTKSLVVRRCTNELRWISMKTGKLMSEPCIVDYALKYANLYFNDTAEIPQGTISVTIQNNSRTKEININDRFVLGKYVYKVKNEMDIQRKETFNHEEGLTVSLLLYMDMDFHDDNFLPDNPNFNPNFPINLANVDKYKDIYKGENPDETGFRVVVTPDKNDILLGQSQVYECYLYDNDTKLSNAFTFSASNVPKSYFQFDIIDGNKFKIKNNQSSMDKKLLINCVSGIHSHSLKITLKGAF